MALWMKILKEKCASMRDGWELEAVSIAQFGLGLTLVLFVVSHHAMLNFTPACSTQISDLVLLGQCYPDLTHPHSLSCNRPIN